MSKEIGWSNESYLLYQVKSLLAKVGSGSTGGISSLNGLTDASQTFAVGTAGAGFSISSSGGVHTFNIPNASASAKGLLTAVDWATFNNKQDALVNAVVKVNFVVGDAGFPSNGATTYTNVLFSGASQIMVFRNGVAQFDRDPGDGDTYFTFAGTTVTFSSPLSTGEKIIVLSLKF